MLSSLLHLIGAAALPGTPTGWLANTEATFTMDDGLCTRNVLFREMADTILEELPLRSALSLSSLSIPIVVLKIGGVSELLI